MNSYNMNIFPLLSIKVISMGTTPLSCFQMIQASATGPTMTTTMMTTTSTMMQQSKMTSTAAYFSTKTFIGYTVNHYSKGSKEPH